MSEPIYSFSLTSKIDSDLDSLQRTSFEDTYGILSRFEADKSIDDVTLRQKLFKVLCADSSKFPFLDSSGKIVVKSVVDYVNEGSFFEKIKKKYILYRGSNPITQALIQLDKELAEIGKTFKKPQTARDAFNFLKRRQSYYKQIRHLKNLNLHIEKAREELLTSLPMWLKVAFAVVNVFDRHEHILYTPSERKDFDVPKTQIGKDIEITSLHPADMRVKYVYDSETITLDFAIGEGTMTALSPVTVHSDPNKQYAHLRFIIQLAVELFYANKQANKLIFTYANSLMIYAGFTTAYPDSNKRELELLMEERKKGKLYPDEIFGELNATLTKNDGAMVHLNEQPMTWQELINQSPLLKG